MKLYTAVEEMISIFDGMTRQEQAQALAVIITKGLSDTVMKEIRKIIKQK